MTTWYGIKKSNRDSRHLAIDVVPTYLLRSRLKFASATYARLLVLYRGIPIYLALSASTTSWVSAGGRVVENGKTLFNTVLERVEVPAACCDWALSELYQLAPERCCPQGVPYMIHQIEDADARQVALEAFASAQV